MAHKTPEDTGKRWKRGLEVVHFNNNSTETAISPFWVDVAARLHLSSGQLGNALTSFPLGLGIGAVLGTLFVRLFGSRAAALFGGTAFFAAMPLAVFAPDQRTFVVLLLIAGVGNGVLDVGWTISADGQMRASNRDAEQHGIEAWGSVGATFGVAWSAVALAGEARLHWGASPVLVLGLLLVAGTMYFGRRLAPGIRGSEEEEEEQEPAARFGRYVAILAVRFFSFLPLGVAWTWSRPFLESLGVRGGVVLLGVGAYVVAEIVSRLLAQVYTKRSRRSNVVAFGALVALAGGLLVVTTDSPLLAVAGLGMVGFGYAPVGPVVRVAVARTATDRNRRRRLATSMVVGFVAGSAGQAAAGHAVELYGDRGSMLLLPLTAGVVLLLARAVPGRGVPAKHLQRGGRHRLP